MQPQRNTNKTSQRFPDDGKSRKADLDGFGRFGSDGQKRHDRVSSRWKKCEKVEGLSGYNGRICRQEVFMLGARCGRSISRALSVPCPAWTYENGPFAKWAVLEYDPT